MRTKLFEIRDSMTFIPAIAIHLLPAGEQERYLLSRAGYGQTIAAQDQYVLFGRLDGGELKCGPSDWPRHSRAMYLAHRHILENWATLQTGDVIDVEHILGESTAPKQSERVDEIEDAATEELTDKDFVP
jgi:hypothetical protein